MAIVVNKPLPEFEANATGGLKVSNTSHNGKIMILYFYPKDNTPGCTTEAMQFRDKFKDFAKAGADIITVHQEAVPHLHRTVQLIKSLGKKAGVSLNPATPVETLDVILDELDLVLIMSVNPGFGGQSFIPSALDKIRALRQRITERGLSTELEVDGGVNTDNIAQVAAAGADTFVAGSAVFGAPDADGGYHGILRKLRAAGSAA